MEHLGKTKENHPYYHHREITLKVYSSLLVFSRKKLLLNSPLDLL